MSTAATCPICGNPLGSRGLDVWQQHAYVTKPPDGLAAFIAGAPHPTTIVTTCRKPACIEAVPNRIPE